MQNPWKRRVAGLGLLVIGILVGLAAAPLAKALAPAYHLNGGPFKMFSGETAYVHVGIDDDPGGPPAQVQVQFLDAAGIVRASSNLTLQAGQFRSVPFAQVGTYRVHLAATDVGTPLGTRRARVSSVEIVNDFTAESRFVCMIHDDSLPDVRPQ